ncbi:hypothetical protein ABIA33_007594 [Streptacidiphilus sp. MAP12-16]|uniref:hypothetical protein n=1 Tax=Streptacidiphilus sp. MAP12-16 TaxID=3156300 RepID=UPI0035152536
MAVRPRTLQRCLAEAGTSWRQELDQARQDRLRHSPAKTADGRARLAGYSDGRALRRAQQRWSALS